MAHAAHGHHHHITPIPKLLMTFITLGVLMAATVAWYYLFAYGLPGTPIYKQLGSPVMSLINNLGMLGIACLKAFLVIQIFMGVKYASNIVKSFAILGFVWCTLMFSMFADYGTRSWEPVRGWNDSNTLAMPRTIEPNEIGVPTRKEMQKQVDSAHGSGKGH